VIYGNILVHGYQRYVETHCLTLL